MKTLTRPQPDASLIAGGVKTFEALSWAPPKDLVGQRIAIHATKTPITSLNMAMWPDALTAAVRDIARDVFDVADRPQLARNLSAALPRGAVVATARLVLVGRITRAPNLTDPEFGHYVLCRTPEGAPFHVLDDGLGFYGEGRWMWLLDDVDTFDEAIPARGRHGLWDWAPPDGWLDGRARLDRFLAGVRALVDGGDAHAVVAMGEELLKELLDGSTAGWLASARAELESAVRILDRREVDTTDLVQLGGRLGELLMAKIGEESRHQERKHVRNLAKRILGQLEEGPLTPTELADRLNENVSEISRASRVLRDDDRLVVERDGPDRRLRVSALPGPDHAGAAGVSKGQDDRET